MSNTRFRLFAERTIEGMLLILLWLSLVAFWWIWVPCYLVGWLTERY